jgi:hypothetical protein
MIDTSNNLLWLMNCLDTATTAAERVRPWRHSYTTDEPSSINKHSPSPGNDPHLHPAQLVTPADVSGTYKKSPESMGEYATTTKPEEPTSRPDVRDLFPKSDDNSDTASDPNVSRF